MRKINIDSEWRFNHGMYGGMAAVLGQDDSRIVNLPHDYMIESDVTKEAPAGPASGYYTAGVAHYTKKLDIPADWSTEEVYLHFDGVMMNATVDINGCKVALQHYGYVPFSVDITPYVYFGKANRVTVTVNPSMQPNCRWYSGAGIYRSVELLHGPKLHIANDGIYVYTKSVEDFNGTKTAYLKSEIEVVNKTLENKMALVEVWLTEDGKEEIKVHRKSKIQINPNSTEVAYIPITIDNPMLWDVDNPNLYRVHARVTDLGEYRTHHIEIADGSVDEDNTIFGIRTISADSRQGLRINGNRVKLKGGCLHHDNGIIGAVSLYDAEYRKLEKLKKQGFNAVRTTHNPPSALFMEACDRLGMYVFDEAFDAWGIMKQPGDYNMFFDTDWKKDLTAFIKRDRSHPSVIIWSTGNEIPERGGLNNGYTLATKLINHVRRLDASRPISNGICSFWSGLDDELTEEDLKKMKKLMSGEATGVQNVDFGAEDLSWETYSEAFTNGLDIVGYNYMEDKYPRDHELYPERVILGSENYPKEIGKRWPMVESTDYVIGDFTWTAYDYIGEAGIGKTVFVEDSDPRLKAGPFALMSHSSEYPWRLANDADIDINGNVLPQGCYRSVVWGSDATFLYSYDPKNYGKTEIVSMWGFTDVSTKWNWDGFQGKQIKLVVFSQADEVELLINEKSYGRKKAGESLAVENLPFSFVFDAVYEMGQATAISYKNGVEISRAVICTTDNIAKLRLSPEVSEIKSDGHSLAYVDIELLDSNGNVVQFDDRKINVRVEGAGELLGFGSANPITDDNYSSGSCTTYRGKALAIIRSKNEPGEIKILAEASQEKDIKDCCVVKSL
ncbi:MAG: glycoside hydrolase family 2 protein [Pseudobutyrivibrio ruminis]|nr:glycoside hydrolase family 2 protein [Pseudobutyrivibrio ruminis]